MSENICVHLDSPRDKFNTLCLMIDKLYALVNKDISPENLDSLAVHEVLLPGHLYLMLLREKLEDNLAILRAKMLKSLNPPKNANSNSKNNGPNSIIEL